MADGPAPTFTDEQLAAIERREGPLLLSAAAGSGKTSVLVERFVWMVVEDGIEPGRILAITFTDKAAGELRGRVRRELVARGHRDLAQEAEGAWIGTFHGFCARVLRTHAVAAGLDPAFAILDEAASRELRSAAFEEAVAGLLGDPDQAPRADALDLLAAYRPERLRTAVEALHGQLRSAGQARPALPSPPAAPPLEPLRAALDAARDAAQAWLAAAGDGVAVGRARAALERCAELPAGEPAALGALERAAFGPGGARALQAEPCARYLDALERYAAACAEAAGAATIRLLDELLGRYSDAYEAGKRARSALDFDDLELRAAELFERLPGVAGRWAGRFDRVMVDEFQDTNARQVALLERLDAGHTFRVGDELQSIYGFRHASVEVFRAARRELARQGAVASLTRNFRTRREVLERVNAASPAFHGEGFAALVPGRSDPPAGEPLVELLLTDRPAAGNGAGGWDEHEPAALPGGPAWRWAEARLLAQRIAELVGSGAHAPSEIVVLVRAATDLACYGHALEERGISMLTAGGGGFWARQQVGDLTAYLAALANPHDEPALLGVLASPLGPALSADGLALLALEARERGRGLWESLVAGAPPAQMDAAEAARLAGWVEAFAAERARAPRLSLAELLARAVRASGYDEHVLRLPGGLRRLANVRKLVRLAEAYERQSGRGVRGFIDRAAAELEAQAREADAPVELAGLDAVRLMTIHAAKGLEFGVVAVADLGRDANVAAPDVLVEGDRVGVRVVTLQGRATTAAYDELRSLRLAREREETLRVFHVALTRARERLILSGAVSVERWPDPANDRCPPVAWLMPAFLPGLAERLLGDGPVVEHDGVRAVLSRPGNGVLEAAAQRAPRPARAAAAAPSTPPAPPVPQPPAQPAALSYSSLSRHAQCGYRFYLERVLRLEPKDPPPAPAAAATAGLDPLVRGTIVHELLEAVDLAAPVAPSAEAIRAVAARHGAEPTDAELADLAALVGGALASEVLRRAAAAVERHAEEPFSLVLGEPHGGLPLFGGVVDLRAVEADGGWLVVDYKTDRLDGADPERVVEADYAVQRRLYALAALRAGAPEVEVVHLFCERPERPASARYRRFDVTRLEAEVAARASDLLAGRFPVAAHPHYALCATCPGRGGMCSWPQERVLVAGAES